MAGNRTALDKAREERLGYIAGVSSLKEVREVHGWPHGHSWARAISVFQYLIKIRKPLEWQHPSEPARGASQGCSCFVFNTLRALSTPLTGNRAGLSNPTWIKTPA